MVLALRAQFDAQLFTSFPKSRFPRIPAAAVHSFLWPEILFRGWKALGLDAYGGALKMAAFGRAMAAEIRRLNRASDLSLTWSSFGLEVMEQGYARRYVTIRDSAHIDFQIEVLEAEYRRFNQRFPEHSFVRNREVKEYALSDRILVLSEFAKRTFLEKGFPEKKIKVLGLGADLSLFTSGPVRTAPGPLRVIYFGTLSIQKGVKYLLEATKPLAGRDLTLTLVGSVDPEFADTLAHYGHYTHFPPMPHSRLAQFIRDFDVFVLPSIHDGFATVVPQAMASGLIPIVTNHCGAAELIQTGRNGFVVPAFSAEAIQSLLHALIRDPAQRVALAETLRKTAPALDWKHYESGLTQWVKEIVSSVPPRAGALQAA